MRLCLRAACDVRVSKRAWLSGQGSAKVPGVAYLQSFGYITHEGTPHPHDVQNVGVRGLFHPPADFDGTLGFWAAVPRLSKNAWRTVPTGHVFVLTLHLTGATLWPSSEQGEMAACWSYRMRFDLIPAAGCPCHGCCQFPCALGAVRSLRV